MRTWRVDPRELAIALVVTAVMCSDVGQSARPLIALPAIAAAGLTLIWRLRAPWLPLIAIVAVNLVMVATPAHRFGPQTVIFGVLLAVYTAAEQLRGRSALAAGLVSVAGVWAGHVVSADGDAADFWPFLIWGVAWGAGRLVRRQTERAREAGARAARLEVEAAEAASHERQRIARELHDVVAHAVSLMVVQAGAERLALGPDDSRTRSALLAIEETGRGALQEMRAMLGLLGSSEDDESRRPQPGLASLSTLVDNVRSAGVKVEWDGTAPNDVSPGLGLVVYRVIQEALTNAVRHGDGVVGLQVGETEHELVLQVWNRLGTPQPGAGRGLRNMRDRVEPFGGSFAAGVEADQWVVRARLPLSVRVAV